MRPQAREHRVLLQFLRAHEAGNPYAFRFEPQDYILPSAGGESPMARFDWSPELLVELQALRRPGCDSDLLQRLGTRLRNFVASGGWSTHEQEIAQALQERRRVVLSIRSSAAELYALPWELLTLRSGRFLGAEDQLLLRFEWPESASAGALVEPRPEGGRVLFAWSAAGGDVPASEHQTAIAAACAAGFQSFDGKTDVLGQASLGLLIDKLEAAQQAERPIGVLHLLCHGAAVGSTFGLCLDGRDKPVVVDATQLRQALAPFAGMIRLVVLMACDSGNLGTPGNHLGSVAQELHRAGFQAVIASRFPLSVAGSIEFSTCFYRELLAVPASLETAFLLARKTLLRSAAELPAEQRRLDWASIQLYARHDDGDDTRPVVVRPYRGLLPFQPEHTRFFFGRDREAEELLADLQALIDHRKPRFVIVAGGSGSGKTSVVFAGAVPKLLAREPQLQLLQMRPGSDPLRTLQQTLAGYAGGTKALLVVDQLEELFSQTAAPTVRSDFTRRLWSLASAPEPGLRIVITLRVDFIGRCGELVLDADGLRLDRIAYDEAHRVFIAQLEPAQLSDAIVEPAHKVGLDLEAGLADRMLDEVNHEPGALPLLEDTLDTLWQQRERGLLTQAVYGRIGGVVGALQKRAEALIEHFLQDGLLEIAQRLLVNLVAVADDTALDTRLRVSLAELQRSVVTEPEAASHFARVLQDLVAARLVVPDGNDASSTLEIAHEALIRKWPRLRTWIHEDRAGLLIQRRVRHAAKQWEPNRLDDSLLYRGTQLAQASEWRKHQKIRLSELEIKFLDASEALRKQEESEEEDRIRREQRRARLTRLLAGVLGVLLIIAGVGWGYAVRATNKARQTSLVLLARAHQADPTKAAQILREVDTEVVKPKPDSKEVDEPDALLWNELAWSALLGGVATTVLDDHEAEITSVAWSADKTIRRLATGSKDETVRVWRLDSSSKPTILQHDRSNVRSDKKSEIRSIDFSPDGKRLATASTDGTAQVFTLDDSGNQVGRPVVLDGHKGRVCAVRFSPGGTKILTGSEDSTARIWNADGSGTSIELPGHKGNVCAVAWHPNKDKEIIATGSHDATVQIWKYDPKAKSWQMAKRMPWTEETTTPGNNRIYAVSFSPDGTQILAGASGTGAQIWKWNLNPADTKPQVTLRGNDSVYSAAWSPDGKMIILGSGDRQAWLWRADGAGEPVALRGHESRVFAVAFSPYENQIVTGSQDKTARIWNVAELRRVTSFQADTAPIDSVVLSADSKKLLTGSRSGVRLWDTEVQDERLIVKGRNKPFESGDAAKTNRIRSVAWSPDKEKIGIVGDDQDVKILSTISSKFLINLPAHTSRIYSISFSPDKDRDKERIATGSEDRTVRIANVKEPKTAVTLQGHTDTVYAVAWSRDGKLVASASGDGRARVWQAGNWERPIVERTHTSGLTSITFSPDGTKVVTGSKDRTACVFSTETSPMQESPEQKSCKVTLSGHAGEVLAVAWSLHDNWIVTGSADQTLRIWNSNGTGRPAVVPINRDEILSVGFSADDKYIVVGSRDGTVSIVRVPDRMEDMREQLWQATMACLPKARRMKLFKESEEEALKGLVRCQHEVARPRRSP